MIHRSLSLACCLLCMRVVAQLPGAHDLTFNMADTGFEIGDGANNEVRSMVRLPDGRMVIAGQFTRYNGTERRAIARLNLDGSLDTTFNAGITSGSVSRIVRQPDGKFIATGAFTVGGVYDPFAVKRFEMDGQQDPTFDVGSGFNEQVNAIALQADGSIVVVGDFDTVNAVPRTRIVRLLTDGSVDLGFDPGTGFNSEVKDVLVEAGGQIFCCGSFSTCDGVARARFARLFSDGSLDPSFVPLNSPAWVNCVIQQPDGRYIAGGVFNGYGVDPVGNIVRIMPSGAFDPSFDTGAGFDGEVNALALLPGGKVFVGGAFDHSDGIVRRQITRLNADGSDDAGFGGNGVSGGDDLIPSVNAIVPHPDGTVHIGGDFFHYVGRTAPFVAHVLQQGAPDPSYNPGHGVWGAPHDIAMQPDDKAIVAGQIWAYDGIERHSIFRTLPDGELDTSFVPAVEFFHWLDRLERVVLQPDGRILIQGGVMINGTYTLLSRLLPDGAVDTTFLPCTQFITTIMDILVQPDGKILLCGDFASYNGTACEHIIRLMPDGTVDSTFQCTNAFDAFVRRMVLQPDGRIICIGGFIGHSGNAAGHIARLNSDGSFDPSYATGAGIPIEAWDIALQSSGKAVIIGVDLYDGDPVDDGVRVNVDGTRDTTFNFTPGALGTVDNRLFIASNDALVITASMSTTVCGPLANGIIRLMPDGSCDPSFDTGTGGNAPLARAAAFQSDERIIVGGHFTSWDGTGRNRLARLHGDLSTAAAAPVPVIGGPVVSPNPLTDGVLQVTGLTPDMRSLQLIDAQGRVVLERALDGGDRFVEPLELRSGIYLVRFAGGGAPLSRRVLVP